MTETIKISNMEELFYQLNSLPNCYVFRGQSNADWGITSTLERILGRDWSAAAARRFEDYSLDIFKSKYHIYSGSEHTPSTKLAWLSVMQHYGVPTRLIDLTSSPYVALYFALESYIPHERNDFSVFAINYTSLMEKSIEHIRSKDNKFGESRRSLNGKQDIVFEDVVDRYSYEIAWITEPSELNARIDRQSGTFLISGNLERPIEPILSAPLYASTEIKKIIIPGALYEGVFAALRKMNINSKSIYGDLSGLAKSIRMELLAYNAPKI